MSNHSIGISGLGHRDGVVDVLDVLGAGHRVAMHLRDESGHRDGFDMLQRGLLGEVETRALMDGVIEVLVPVLDSDTLDELFDDVAAGHRLEHHHHEDMFFPSMDGVALEGWFIPADSDRLVIHNHFLDSMYTAPAVVLNGSLDIVAANPLSRALYSVGLLRAEAARSPESPALTDVIGGLATRSALFPTRWAAHAVTAHRRGTKQFRHHVVGELTLTFNVLTIAAEPGLSLVAYTATPDSASAEALALLASWSATEQNRT